MKSVRTPDECFDNLFEYPFSPNYIEVDDYEGGLLRMHYLDEGEPDAAPILLLHGEPTWSYLYRKMIPVLVGAGHRVIAPDLIGFGKSDKPIEFSDYTYARHVAWVKQVIDQLELNEITLFAQDWGGLIGLRLVAENENRFSRVVVGNTRLPVGETPSEFLKKWVIFSQTDSEFEIGGIVARFGAIEELDPAVRAAYNAPFPDSTYKAGARIFPGLVPASDDDPAIEANLAAWKILESWKKPFLTAYSDGDFNTQSGVPKEFQRRVPGALGHPHVILKGAGHFLQEQVGPELAEVINRFIAEN
jgi:haloalkane dehalogenase